MIGKKDESSYSHSTRPGAVQSNRGKPISVPSTNKPANQSASLKAVGSNVKPTTILNQSQAPINNPAIGSGIPANRQQQPSKMAPRFNNKQQRDRTGSTSSNTWEKGDIAHMGDHNDADFVQRPNSSIQSIDKLSQDSKADAKMSTIIFENTNYKSMPAPIKRQTPSNQQQIQNAPQPQRGGVNQYDQVQPNNLGHHSHHSQNPHHLDKKADDVFKNASSGNFQDMLDSQQQVGYTLN